QEIPEADFIADFNTLYQKVHQDCKLIQFEWLFLLALIYFKKQKIDLVILEVGIGGLYDTTNIIPHKLVAAITTIDYDHQQLLGETLTEITQQKIGIITENTQYAFIGNIKDTDLLKLM